MDAFITVLRRVIHAYDHHQANLSAGLGVVSNVHLRAAIDDARAALQGQGNTDTERLDWMQANGSAQTMHLGGQTRSVQHYGVASHESFTLREAIDTLMASQKK